MLALSVLLTCLNVEVFCFVVELSPAAVSMSWWDTDFLSFF